MKNENKFRAWCDACKSTVVVEDLSFECPKCSYMCLEEDY